MRLLLDTNVLVWLSVDPERIPDRVVEALTLADGLFVSVVSGWEYGLKRARHRAEFRLSFVELVADLNFLPLGLEFDCHRFAETLPDIHRDPFDRMLVAQAINDELTLVTADTILRRYPVATFW